MGSIPDYIGRYFRIDLDEIDIAYRGVVINEVEELLKKGVEIYNPYRYYYPYRDTYYRELERRLADLL